MRFAYVLLANSFLVRRAPHFPRIRECSAAVPVLRNKQADGAKQPPRRPAATSSQLPRGPNCLTDGCAKTLGVPAPRRRRRGGGAAPPPPPPPAPPHPGENLLCIILIQFARCLTRTSWRLCRM